MQHGEKDGVFGVEGEAAADEGATQAVAVAAELPETLED